MQQFERSNTVNNRITISLKGSIISAQSIAPAFVSLIIVTVSFLIRRHFGFVNFPALFIFPIMIFLLAVCVFTIVRSIMSAQYNSGDNAKVVWKASLIYVFKILLIALIALRVMGVVWGSGYLTPLFEAQYTSGSTHVDTLFHAAIANMLLYFGVPSIGVEGVVPFQYHFASHWLIGHLGKIIGVNAFCSYHLIYPAVILPLFLLFFLALSEVAGRFLLPDISIEIQELCALVLFFLATAGIFPETFRDNVAMWNSAFISENYSFSLTMLYLFILLLFIGLKAEKRGSWAVILYCGIISFLGGVIITLSKISTGTLWCVGLFAWWIQQPRNLKRLLPFLTAGIGWLIIFHTVQRINGASEGFVFAHFLLNYVDHDSIFYYTIVHYGNTASVIVLLGIYILRSKLSKDQGKTIQIILFIIALVGAIPGFIIAIPGGSAFYFLNINFWVSLPMLVPLISNTISEKWLVIKQFLRLKSLSLFFSLIFLFPLTTALLNTSISTYDFIRNSLQYIGNTNVESLELWRSLSRQEQNSANPIAIEYATVPPYGTRGENDKTTWISSYLSASAIAGAPTINEVEQNLAAFKDERLNYGFDELLYSRKRTAVYANFKVVRIEY